MRREWYGGVLALALIVGLLSMGTPAGGQAFPGRPIEFVVPFAAGGGSDLLGRAIAKIIADERLLPVPLVVVNRAGGSGAGGWAYLLTKRGDPYFLATVSGSVLAAPPGG